MLLYIMNLFSPESDMNITAKNGGEYMESIFIFYFIFINVNIRINLYIFQLIHES
jgi:hypothetical protein